MRSTPSLPTTRSATTYPLRRWRAHREVKETQPWRLPLGEPAVRAVVVQQADRLHGEPRVQCGPCGVVRDPPRRRTHPDPARRRCQVRQPQPKEHAMTDRPMTGALASALAALSPSQRRMLTVIAGESERDWLRGLLLGLVAEVDLMERQEAIEKMHEITTLHAHEVDHLADVDKAAEGADWSHVVAPAPRTEEYWPLGHPEEP